MATKRVVFFLSAAALVLLAIPATAGAAADNTVALYQMNEPAGASVLADSSGNGLNGIIGADVTTGATYNGATGHRWANLAPNGPREPGRITNVAHDNRLNPGTGEYAFTVRYRTTRSFGNIIQKGQSGTSGGYFKLQNPGGVPECMYRGGDGSQRGVTAGRNLSDGEWHTVRCERRSDSVAMYIDGVYAARIDGVVGNIANTAPLSIGGKTSCNPPNVTCDYFAGDIDYVRIENQGAPDTSPPTAPGTPTATSTRSGQVDLSWAAATDDRADSLTYRVYRDSSTTPIANIGGPLTGTIRYTDTGRSPGARHTYRVRAFDGTQNGAFSATSNTVTVAGAVVASTPPSGRYDSLKVDGRYMVVRGLASDPDGTPVIRVTTTWDGRRFSFERASSGGQFAAGFNTEPGDHTVCVEVLDTPTRAAKSLGCKTAVVK